MVGVRKINNPDHPVILFIPEAGIYSFVRGLSVLGDAIRKQGGKVLITHDTGQMLRSPLMGMHRTSVDTTQKEWAKIHKITEKPFRSVLKNYKFSSIELANFVDEKLMDEIISLADVKTKDLKAIKYKGFPVGEIVEFDFILETKFPYSSGLSKEHKKLYLQYLRNTALAIAVADRICKKYKPSLLITFNEYSQCQGAKYSALKNGVNYWMLTYPVHLNIDASKFSICSSTYPHWRYKHNKNWEEAKSFPIEAKNVLASWNDSIFRMFGAGSHIFSTRKENDPSFIFKKLKLDSTRKTIVVYTSSQDERMCGEITMKIWKENNHSVDAFSNQIEWILMLRRYAEENNDIQIVVRIHPREGLRQHGVESQHLQKLKKVFKKSTKNFKIVWPNDKISSYDLMELADICLVAWSTMGQEAARVGIPVLSFAKNMYYPDDDFIQTASTRKEYKKKLDKILDMDYKWQYLVKAIRFYHWRTFIPSLDFSKFIPADSDDSDIWPKVPSSVVGTINNILSGKEDLIEHNIEKWQKSLSKNAEDREKEAMKKGIRYFLDKIYYPPKNVDLVNRIWRYAWRKITGNYLWVPKDSFKDYHLIYTDDLTKMGDLTKKTRHNSKLRVLIVDGQYAMLIHKGRVLRRMSPMVIRLAKLHENA